MVADGIDVVFQGELPIATRIALRELVDDSFSDHKMSTMTVEAFVAKLDELQVRSYLAVTYNPLQDSDRVELFYQPHQSYKANLLMVDEKLYSVNRNVRWDTIG